MKKTTIIFISLFTFLLSYSQTIDPIKREINKIIRYETNIDYKETPGFIVGMIDKDENYIIPFGQKNIDDPASLSSQDVFEIGGISKIYTATLLYKIKDEFHISIDSSINDYLPIKNTSFQSCSIDDLLRHTSGLPKYPPGWGSKETETQNPYAHFTQTDLEEFFTTYQLNKKDENIYVYSHLNFVFLQWVLESITGETYTELLKKHLPEWSKSMIENTECTTGYGRNVKPSTPWTTSTFTGSTGVKANLLEVMTLAKSFLNTNEEMAKSLLVIENMKVRNQSGYVARGWQAFPLPKDKYAYYHTGRTDGHYSFVAIKPDTHTAVIVLANSSVGADLLGINILRMMNENWRRK